MITGRAGIRWNLSDASVVAGSFTILLTSAGLNAPFSPYLGFDYLID
jgi:hypothetical protein